MTGYGTFSGQAYDGQPVTLNGSNPTAPTWSRPDRFDSGALERAGVLFRAPWADAPEYVHYTFDPAQNDYTYGDPTLLEADTQNDRLIERVSLAAMIRGGTGVSPVGRTLGSVQMTWNFFAFTPPFSDTLPAFGWGFPGEPVTSTTVTFTPTLQTFQDTDVPARPYVLPAGQALGVVFNFAVTYSATNIVSNVYSRFLVETRTV